MNETIELPQITVRPNEPVSLDPPPPPDNPVSLDITTPEGPPAPDVAADRAFKAHFGLGTVLGKPFDDIYRQIASGGEQNVRKEAAAKLDQQNISTRDKLLAEVAQLNGPDYEKYAARILHPENTKPIDPDIVFEQGFAHGFTGMIDVAATNMQDTNWDKAKEEIPEEVRKAMDSGSEVWAKREFATTLLQNISKRAEGQSWLGFIGDLAKPIVTGGMYDEFKLRGWMKSIPQLEGLGLGENLDKQTSALLQLPLDQYKSTLLAIASKLEADNPQAAKRFVGAVLGESASERVLSNLSLPLNVAMLPGAGAATGKLASMIGLAGTSRRVVQDTLRAGAKTIELNQGKMLEAAGDAHGAGIKQAVVQIIDDGKGTTNLEQRSLQGLVSAALDDRNKMVADQGSRAGQEIVDRLLEQDAVSTEKFADAVVNSARPDTNPEILRQEAAMTALLENAKDLNLYRGPANMIRNIDLKTDAVTNTRYYYMELVREDGSAFTSQEEAIGKAYMQGIVPELPEGYLKNLENQIKDLIEEVKIPPDMDADVHGLNRQAALEEKLAELQQQYATLSTQGKGGYAIKPDGHGFYIELTQPMKTNDPLVKSFVPAVNENASYSAVKAYFNQLRSPEDTLPLLENEQRHNATFGPSVMQEKVADDLRLVVGVEKKYWDDFLRALDASRKMFDPNVMNPKAPGYFFESIGELEDFYQFAFQRMPSDKELQGYFAFKRAVARDYGGRLAMLARAKMRVGTEQHRFFVKGADGKPLYAPYVEGIIQKEFPGGHDIMYVPGVDGSKGKLYSTTTVERTDGSNIYNLPTAERQKLQEEMAQGGVWMRVFNPDLHPLKGWDKLENERVRYVFMRNVQTKPIELTEQLNRTGGGHFVPDYDFNIKQHNTAWDPIIQKFNFTGETHFAGVKNEKLGRDYATHLNEFMRLEFKEGNSTAAEQYLKDKNVGIAYSKMKSWFVPKKDPVTGEIHPPRFDKENAFYVVPKDKTIMDIDKSLPLSPKYMGKDGKTMFRDGTKEGSDARALNVEYTQERDAHEIMTINDVGSKGNPVYSYEPGALIDPITIMNRSTVKLTNSFFMEDIKDMAMERWVKRAENFIDGDINDIRHSPQYYFHKGNLLPHADKFAKVALEDERAKIKQFIGLPSATEKWIQAAGFKLANAMYSGLGPKGLYVSNAMLPYLTDPIRFARAMTYHMKMGLFSIPQLFTQMTTGLNVAAISGEAHAGPSMIAALLHEYSRVNSSPAILAHLDKMASSGLGWKPGQWLEARKIMIDRFGFSNIGGEHAVRNNPLTTKIVQSGGSQILDWGEMPFREGALTTRYAALYAAYHEFRNGGGGTYAWKGSSEALSRVDLDQILSRAQLLDHNMNRAANSRLQTGITAPMTQFAAYPMRLAELMWGKRLTGAEKMRLLTVSSMAYGVPMGVLGTAGIPATDYIAEQFKAHGYVIGDDKIYTLLSKGIPSYGLYMATGKVYNIDKWGTKGLDQFFDPTADKTVWDIAFGATGTTMKNWFKESEPFRMWAYGKATGDPNVLPLRVSDLIDLTGWKEVQSLSAGARHIAALNTHNWINKNGGVLEADVGAYDAWFRTISGLTNSEVSDLQLSNKALKAEEELQKWGEQGYLKEMHNWAIAAANNDWDNADSFAKRAEAYLARSGYPSEKRGQLEASFVRNERPQIDRTDNRYYFRNVPENRKPASFEAGGRVQQMKDNK